MEIWKDIEGGYKVSSFGNIINGFSKPIKPFINKGGYLEVSIYYNKKRYPTKMHRIIAFAFIPNPNNLKEINHIDGDKTNNNINNLEWCTRGENIKHAYNLGLRKPNKLYGDNSTFHKLSKIQVIEIREKYATKKYSQTELACEYNVARATIGKIVNNLTWKHI